MAINPMLLMQMKNKLTAFDARHPRLKLFFADVFSKLEADDVLELSVTKADGRKIRTNIKVTNEDKELLQALTEMLGQQQ